eukprot:5182688-Prymnesium_polylepis.1
MLTKVASFKRRRTIGRVQFGLVDFPDLHAKVGANINVGVCAVVAVEEGTEQLALMCHHPRAAVEEALRFCIDIALALGGVCRGHDEASDPEALHDVCV